MPSAAAFLADAAPDPAKAARPKMSAAAFLADAPSPYETTQQFDGDMDRAFGKGAWRDTGDYRSPAREAQLRSQGAATARGTSAHSLGTPDAPGAHDIVVGGMDPAQAAQRLPKGYSGLPEGPAGGQGAHLHVGARQSAAAFLGGGENNSPHNSATIPAAPAKPSAADFLGLPADKVTGRRVAPAEIAAIAGPRHPQTAQDRLAKPLINPLGDIADAASQSWQAGKDAYRRQGEAYAKGDTAGGLKAGGERVVDALGVMASPFAAVSEPAARLIDKMPTETKHVVDHGHGHFTMEGPPELTPEQQAEQAEFAGNVVTGLPGGEEALSMLGRGAKTAAGVLHDTGIVGAEKDPLVRADNALYRLGGHATADKIEAKKFLKALPKEITDPKVQERLYHAIEAKLADPKAEIPHDLKGAFKAMEPWYKEQTAIINRLRARGDEALEPYLEDQGYVSRRVQGKSPGLDPLDPTERPKDPILGGRASLAKTTGAMKSRKFLVLDDGKGKRTFLPPDKVPKEWKAGMDVRGPSGKPATLKQATTAEIEANTEVRYHKNATVNTVDNVLRLRRVERNLQVLDQLTSGMKDERLAHHDEWFHKNEAGETVVRRANTERPAGFVELPHIPQLKGWSFDPKVAEVLKDYRPGPEEPIDGVIAKINRTLTASLFITPVPHALNVGAHWAVGRGWDWAKPTGYARLMKTGSRAMGEVLGMGPKYRQMLREGSGLLYGDTQTRDFYQLMMQKAAGEIVGDRKAYEALRDSLGIKGLTPRSIGQAIYSASNKALWFMSDVFMMQRQLELESKGLSTREAIRQAEVDIPNYRVPPRVLGSRELKQALTDGRLVMFGRYKYGQMKAWGSMFRDLYKGSPAEKREALGKFLVAAIISQGVYPIADKAVQLASGNKDARMKRSGPFSLTDSGSRLEQGQIGWAQAVSSFISPAPGLETGLELLNNRDLFSGRPIIEPESTPAGKAAQGAEFAAGAFYPAQLGMETLKPGGPAAAAGKLVGLDLPPEGREGAQAKSKKYAARQARGREKKDPLTQMLAGLGQ